jgi:ankyrin repeat protein
VEHLVVNDPDKVNARGGYFLIPLVAALAGGHFQTAQTLHDNGAHPNFSGILGRTPLHSVAFYGEIEIVQVLLKHKADVTARTDDGETSLYFASEGYSSRCPNVARLLLQHGAGVNAQRNDGSTPLHVAARYGRVETLRVLLEHGANVGVAGGGGRTASQVASDHGHDEITKLLSEHAR